ncbi:MAG: membrane integrity-associated transporter subunit PqiC [Pseudomonadota bacterium]|nr:membrane integrity-associated transporter subunit PqiC [Pseudomonadota bacterium]
METRVRFIIVGAFAMAAIVGVFLFAFWIHGAGGLANTRSLRVEFAGSATGLRPGSAVLFNGVRIGEVTRITFDPVRADLVNADLAVEAAAPLRADARVTVEAQGLLGTTVVAIYGVSAEAPLLPASAVLHAGASSSLTGEARAALADLRAILADNKAPLADILKNVDTFSQALGRNSGKLDGIVAGLEKFLGQGPKPPPPQFLTLRAPRDFSALTPISAQIAVADLAAPVAFQTQRIMSRAGPDSPLTLGEAQWTDATPKLLQLNLVEAFENAHLGGSVGLPLDSGAPDFQLMIELRRFEIDLAEHAAVIELAARLVGKDGRVAAAKLFHGASDSAASDGEAAARALGAAFGQVASQIVEWTVQTTK